MPSLTQTLRHPLIRTLPQTHPQRDTALYGQKQPQKQPETQRQRYSYIDHPHAYPSQHAPQDPNLLTHSHKHHSSHRNTEALTQSHTPSNIPHSQETHGHMNIIHIYVYTHTPAAKTHQTVHLPCTHTNRKSHPPFPLLARSWCL